MPPARFERTAPGLGISLLIVGRQPRTTRLSVNPGVQCAKLNRCSSSLLPFRRMVVAALVAKPISVGAIGDEQRQVASRDCDRRTDRRCGTRLGCCNELGDLAENHS